MLQVLIYLFLGLLVFAFLMHTIVRIVRHFYKFPMPEFFANIIDNPLRRKIQPPSEMPIRHEIEPGMTVLEVGPGNGTYTVATARRVGNNGKVITVDIEPKMIERVTRRTQVEGTSNIEARVANVYALPFEDSTFDVVYMIAVISEIPEPARAMNEFYRVLTPKGRLVFSELLFDPDYPLAQTLIRKANSVNFRLKRKMGNFFSYTLIFEKNIQQNTAYR